MAHRQPERRGFLGRARQLDEVEGFGNRVRVRMLGDSPRPSTGRGHNQHGNVVVGATVTSTVSNVTVTGIANAFITATPMAASDNIVLKPKIPDP